MGEEGFRRAEIEEGRHEFAHRADDLLAFFDGTDPTRDHRHGWPAVELGRDDRKRRDVPVNDERGELVRRVRDPVAVEAENLRGSLHRPEDRTGEHGRADRIQGELELGDDPEVAAGAADPPEEVRILGRARPQDPRVGGHELDAQQLVDRQAVFPHEPPDPAAERQTGEPGVGHDAGRDGEPEGLRRAVELAEKHASLHARRALFDVDADGLHRRKVDNETAVARREAREAVAAATDRSR